MIHFLSPYSTQKDLGQAYNLAMDLIPEEDWVCFIDLDCMFLTSNIGHQLQEIINIYPETGLFTALTNRVGRIDQCYNNFINEDPNVLNHKRIAIQLQQQKRITTRELTGVISGMLMLISKKTWNLIHGAPEGRGLLAIDNHISQRVLDQGLKIRLMEGVYIFHFYRLDVGVHNKSHLIIPIDSPEGQVQLQTTARRKKRSRFI